MDRATRTSGRTADRRSGFDADAWLAAHTQALARGDTDRARGLRIDVALDTIDCATRGAYVLGDGTRVDLPTEREVRDQVRDTVLYRPKDVRRAAATATLYDALATCEVVRGDCLRAAVALKTDRGLNPAVLNMASSRRPGGGYKTGAAAQEENIFRRSNYFLSLEDPRRIDRQRQWRYPLQGLCGIYSPSVSVFRGPEDEGYPFLDRPVCLDFIAVPAIVRPRLHVLSDGAQRLGQDDADLMRQKIALILDIALAHKHDAVVLGAFGCGAFGNPPDHVALLFREVLSTDAYRCRFKHICFAIFDDHNAGRGHNPRGNVAPFCDVFATPLTDARDAQPPPTASGTQADEIRTEAIYVPVGADPDDIAAAARRRRNKRTKGRRVGNKPNNLA
ncbi:hypothetical protein psal_cds_1283 [Pandoravirus salinus]|uniref:Microbial-type PARG catalytic domain-containing protein n=1 Tax=Pandoravirus salinus TaxID=1349410 RepID=S4W4K1_9VIRU|nr:hypothetical protein psal_cds_1283 [Pandoravirus salinus]AGO85642.2 hypothetical protein psal_cds_1283 [Pandoravirus salinus]